MFTNVMLPNFRRHGAHNLEDGLGFLIVDLEVVHLENPEGHSHLIHAVFKLGVRLKSPSQVSVIRIESSMVACPRLSKLVLQHCAHQRGESCP